MDALAPTTASHRGSSSELLASVLYLARSTLWRRYCGSLLGFGWSILNPVVTIGVYFVVFRIFVRVPIENYFLYLVAGLLPWTFLASALLSATHSLVDRRAALHCSTANHLVFILADTTVELFTFVTSYAVLLVLSALFVEPAEWSWIALPLLNLPLIVTVYAGCVAIAYLAARYRDLPHLLQMALNVFFWLMPIVYHWSMVPQPFSLFVKYNPISILISPGQVLVHGGQFPNLGLMAVALAFSALSAWLGYECYRRLRRDIIFYL